jgi:hypothetical protein
MSHLISLSREFCHRHAQLKLRVLRSGDLLRTGAGILQYLWPRSCSRHRVEANAEMATHERKKAPDLGDQAIRMAEELGRIAGTIEGTAESVLSRQELADQLTQLRDTASQMLEGLTAGAARAGRSVTAGVRGRGGKKTAKRRRAVSTRQPDPSRAPGKRRRTPAPSMRGVKKSDERIPKLRTAAAVRQRRKSYA